jgi:predicted nuclease of predicted toxin-antitoxin system
MIPKFIADENIPSQVLKALREAGYDVAAVDEAAHSGMKNDELAKLSIKLKLIVITRDADFTHLSQSLTGKIKVVYIRLSGDPNSIAQQVLDNIEGASTSFVITMWLFWIKRAVTRFKNSIH